MDPSSANGTNPLVRARLALDPPASQETLADLLGVSLNVVKWAEAGCYNVIPSCYKKHPTVNSHNNLSTPSINREYQLYRRLRRQRNFSVNSFPVEPPNSMEELLKHLNLTPYSFATKACVQHGEVHKLLMNQKVTIPINLVDFFQAVGLNDAWILHFNRNINELNYLETNPNYL